MKRSLAAVARRRRGRCRCSWPDAAAATTPSAASSGPVTLTLAGWSLATTPEFKTLADGFHAANPNVTVQLKEYDATNYDTQMIADLAAGKAPGHLRRRRTSRTSTPTRAASSCSTSPTWPRASATRSAACRDYQVDGKTYAIPYRQDSWVLFYNKALFDKAGVDVPGRLLDVGRLRDARPSS